MSTEKLVKVKNGWSMLAVVLILMILGIALLVESIIIGTRDGGDGPLVWMFVLSLLIIVLDCFLMPGFFTLQPNEARVLILFGKYKGTVREDGFHWGNPFYSNGPAAAASQQSESLASAVAAVKRAETGKSSAKQTRYKISLRARTLNTDKLKVNDKNGNPVEIGAVVVWRVKDTAQATFDVDDYEQYVAIQSESALRHVATAFAYDRGDDDADPSEITLRGNVEEVSAALRAELEIRLGKAGVVIDDARLTHLAYAPEIAQAMLRRQQAEAVIAARKKIVIGAVSMVEMALDKLAEEQVVELDEERKAAMVSNLMVVLCGESEVHPIVNAGTLYQ